MPTPAELLREAASRAIPPVSRFHVGCVVQGLSGQFYQGWNLEFVGQVFHQTVHAEQFAVGLAALHGERGITKLWVTHAPCGHCRQFLCELPNAESLRIEVEGRPEMTLPELLPFHFGPSDLEVREPLLAHSKWDLPGPGENLLEVAALEGARRSYAPYSRCPAGVAFVSRGVVYMGSLLENAAYNPSLPPLQSALIRYYAEHSEPPRIEAAVLWERPGEVSQEAATRSLLATLAPGVTLCVRGH